MATIYRAIEVILGVGDRAGAAGGLRRGGADGGPLRASGRSGLVVYLGVGVLGLAIQVLVVYQPWIILVARMPLRRVLGGARRRSSTRSGPASSLATLPVTLRSSTGWASRRSRPAGGLRRDEPEQRRHLALRGDGRALRRPGDRDPADDRPAAARRAASCVIAGIGISGVPDAGLISLLIVLKTVNLPETVSARSCSRSTGSSADAGRRPTWPATCSSPCCSTGSRPPSPRRARAVGRADPGRLDQRRGSRRSQRLRRPRSPWPADASLAMTPTGFEPVLHA